MIKRIIFIIVLFLCFTPFNKAQWKTSKIISDFTSNDFTLVYKAKKSLLNMGENAIPFLIELMENKKEYKKLINTADLIYPGTIHWYGHGWGISYDIDWIAIRAGWVLEKLSFQKFGFKEIQITDSNLIYIHNENYPKYILRSLHDENYRKDQFQKLSLSIKKVKTWKAGLNKNWTCLTGLRDSIFSEDTTSQKTAIYYLRNPDFDIEGFTKKYFSTEIKNRIKELAKSKNENINQQAKYLLKK